MRCCMACIMSMPSGGYVPSQGFPPHQTTKAHRSAILHGGGAYQRDFSLFANTCFEGQYSWQRNQAAVLQRTWLANALQQLTSSRSPQGDRDSLPRGRDLPASSSRAFPHFHAVESAVKARFRRFGATGAVCWLSVVQVRRRLRWADNPRCHINRAMRFWPQQRPWARNSAWMCGLP